tara:strand:+ start:277 stop:549 length:273 start_codon:yes stop_codon:yes gene_type:complete
MEAMEAFKEIQEAIQTAINEYNQRALLLRKIWESLQTGTAAPLSLRIPILDITSTLEEINRAIIQSDRNAEEQTTTTNAWAVFLCIWDNQ